jgi:hypothetical protein
MKVVVVVVVVAAAVVAMALLYSRRVCRAGVGSDPPLVQEINGRVHQVPRGP